MEDGPRVGKERERMRNGIKDEACEKVDPKNEKRGFLGKGSAEHPSGNRFIERWQDTYDISPLCR